MNMAEQTFDKTELFRVPKKEGVSMVVTRLDKNGKRYVDIRERVDEPKEGWEGWTKRGVTIPAGCFVELIEESLGVLDSITK